MLRFGDVVNLIRWAAVNADGSSFPNDVGALLSRSRALYRSPLRSRKYPERLMIAGLGPKKRKGNSKENELRQRPWTLVDHSISPAYYHLHKSITRSTVPILSLPRVCKLE